MADSFTEERLKILKIEVDNMKMRVGKLDAQVKQLLTKVESLDENIHDLYKWR